jgi:hypothetical protein
MPKYRVTTPTGETFDVNAPDGATQEDAFQYVSENHGVLRRDAYVKATQERAKGPAQTEQRPILRNFISLQRRNQENLNLLNYLAEENNFRKYLDSQSDAIFQLFDMAVNEAKKETKEETAPEATPEVAPVTATNETVVPPAATTAPDVTKSQERVLLDQVVNVFQRNPINDAQAVYELVKDDLDEDNFDLTQFMELLDIYIDNDEYDDVKDMLIELRDIIKTMYSTSNSLIDKKADIERRRQEVRGEALERIGIDRVGFDGKERSDWKDAKDQDLKIATNHAIERLSKNPNVKIASLPSAYSNAIKAELEIHGVKTTDKTSISEIIEKLKEINTKYDAELAALEITPNTTSQEETNDQQTTSFVDSNPEFFSSINQEAQTISEEDSLNNLKNNSCKS